jgi:sugar-specific transcriptional regulator TrmB/DNA-binding CsgD family transcriptional regulator
MLDVLGLDDLEERAYRHLVQRSPGSAAEVAEATGLDESRAAQLLGALEARGLVARATGGGYVASPPAVALGALMVQRQQELRQAELDLENLKGLYREGVAQRGSGDVVDVVRGSEAVAQRFGQLQQSARREVQVLVKSGVAVVSPDDNDEVESGAQARGVAYRVVVEREVLERPGFVSQAESSLAGGMQVRVARTVPIRLIVVDRELALVPLASTEDEQDYGALLIHPSPLLESLQAMFDLVWEGAARLVLSGDGVGEAAGDVLEELDARVLSLLMAGLTDHAVGKQLDLSMRTVQRRVRHMMDRAGVDTRLQLGREATRRGWI